MKKKKKPLSKAVKDARKLVKKHKKDKPRLNEIDELKFNEWRDKISLIYGDPRHNISWALGFFRRRSDPDYKFLMYGTIRDVRNRYGVYELLEGCYESLLKKKTPSKIQVFLHKYFINHKRD